MYVQDAESVPICKGRAELFFIYSFDISIPKMLLNDTNYMLSVVTVFEGKKVFNEDHEASSYSWRARKSSMKTMNRPTVGGQESLQ